MRYTPEQYSNMVKSVVSYCMEAEHHNWRIIRRLENETELIDLHKQLEKKLEECMTLTLDIEERLN